MHKEFEKSVMGKLKIFLDFQINQCCDRVYIHQIKYSNELLKKFELEEYKSTLTPMYPACNIGKNVTSSKVYQKVYI